MNLTCVGPSDTITFVWTVNGDRSTSAVITRQNLADRGITYNSDVIKENNKTFTRISIETRAENDNTSFGCVSLNSDFIPLFSNEELCSEFKASYTLTLVIYSECVILYTPSGLLEAPTALETEQFNSTHNVLRWTASFTLDLTDILHDISGYTVTVTMEHPPPQHPYDLSLTLEQLNQTVNQTYHISHSGRASFPRYAFPVWLSVSAENPVGQGATSLPLKYTPPTPEGCLRLYGEQWYW